MSNENAEQIFRNEVDIYNKYINGECYRWEIEKELKEKFAGSEISAWAFVQNEGGFYDEDEAIEECKIFIDAQICYKKKCLQCGDEFEVIEEVPYCPFCTQHNNHTKPLIV